MDSLLHSVTKTRVNVYLTILQVVVSGLTFFLLYRYLYEALGAEKIGLWSLVIAFASSARLGELGLAGGVVKFVAEARGQDDHLLAAKLIQTVLITLTVVLLVLAFPAFKLFALGLNFLVDEPYVYLGIQILPYTLLSISMMVGVAVIAGGMDGYMLMGLRNVVLSFSHIMYLVLVYFLVPSYDILGVAYAQCIQYVFLITTLWVLMKVRLRELPFVPHVWDFWLLRKMLRYGVTFQTITVVNMFFEPLIKVSMTYWSGLANLGLYEMANKLALQVRSIIVESNRIIVPMLAGKKNNSNNFYDRKELVLKSFRLVSFSSICLFGLMLVASPIISLLWLGEINDLFLLFLFIVSMGWAFNTLTGPVYFLNLATGSLAQNLMSHCITCLSGIILSNLMGYFFKAWGVILAASFSLMAGGLYLLVWYFLSLERIKLYDIIPTNFFIVLFWLFLCFIISGPIPIKIIGTYSFTLTLSLLALSSVICLYCLMKLMKKESFDASEPTHF